jgi:hypothetical protein
MAFTNEYLSAAQKRNLKARNRLEIANTIILGIVTLAVIWCSYQSHVWGSIQTFRLAESYKWYRMSHEKNLTTVQHAAMDETIVVGFVRDVTERRDDRVKFLLEGIRPELSAILKSWLASQPLQNANAPAHPMATKEYLDLLDKGFAEAKKFSTTAEWYYEQAEEADSISDGYNLFAVIFSVLMFLVAVTTKITQVRLGLTLVIFSGLTCIILVAVLFSSMPLAIK